MQAEIANAGELIEQQKQDAELDITRAWLEHPDMVPDKNALHAYEPGIQELWAQKRALKSPVEYCIKDMRPERSLLHLQVLVPQSLHTAFLDAVHAAAISGHPGIERTRERLQELAYWKGWTGDVQAYVQRCPVCTAHRPGPRRKQGQM